MPEPRKIRSVVLLSGGLDSSVNLFRAARETDVTLALTFRYGQMAADREEAAAAAQCRLLGIENRVVELPWLAAITQTALVDPGRDLPEPAEDELDDLEASRARAAAVWVPHRNGVFVAVGAAFAESLGAHAVVGGFNAEEGLSFPDNSAEFLSAANRLLSLSTLNRTKLISYTASLSKPQIAREAAALGVPLAFLWSCYRAGPGHCRQCESCRRLERALRAAGAWDGFLESPGEGRHG